MVNEILKRECQAVWRVRASAHVETTKPSSSTSVEDFMMKGFNEVTG